MDKAPCTTGKFGVEVLYTAPFDRCSPGPIVEYKLVESALDKSH